MRCYTITTTMTPIIEDYESSLRELTFNSRPIIDNLTIIAKENTHDAPGIVAVITQRIYKCIPEQKLFALYLLDLICKIVGEPYTILFGGEIFKLFSHVYLLVDEATRARLAKIYELWRVTRTRQGLPLFTAEQLDKIGGFLRQAGYRQPGPSGLGPMPGSAGPLLPPVPTSLPPVPSAPASHPGALPGTPVQSAGSLVGVIDELLPVLNKKLALAPADTALAGKVAALAELRVILLSQPLGPSELAGIQAKLVSMKNQELASAQAPQPPQAQEIFQTLIHAGLVTVDQSLKPGSKPVYTVVLPKYQYQAGKGPSAGALELLLADTAASGSQYDRIRFKELVKVSHKIAEVGLQAFVTLTLLDAATVQVLYETKDSKCAQCGKRFTSDASGAQRKRLHLDWHFRINKKQANYKTNIQLRSWYLDDLAWVRFRDSELSEYEQSAPAKPVEVAKPVDSFVVIPANETNMNNTCTVCRELIKPSYKDSVGEWVWDQCVSGGGRRVTHVTCIDDSRKRGPDDDARGVKRERVY